MMTPEEIEEASKEGRMPFNDWLGLTFARSYAEVFIKHLGIEGITVQFICNSCRENEHKSCTGATWCDCQHKEKKGSIDER